MKNFLLFFIVIFTSYNISYSAPQLEWSSYLGGTNQEYFGGFKVDSSGNSFIAGCTTSNNYPTTLGSYNNTFIFQESFITKLNSKGTKLIFSTFIGPVCSYDGSIFYEVPSGNELIIDKFGNSYITGAALKTYPLTQNVYDTNFYSNNENTITVYITKLNSTGTALIYSTFIGGGAGISMGIDSSCNAFIAGDTRSILFPTTSGAYNSIFNDTAGHTQDIFITKLNQNADSLIYSTFIGGTNGDWINDISIDSLDNVLLTGNTISDDFPTSSNAYYKSYRGNRNIIITKLNKYGDSLLYSTYFGGINCDQWGTSNVTDSKNNIYFTGWSYCSDYPTTIGAYNRNRNGSNWNDIIITKLDSMGDSLIFSTYLGGTQEDYGCKIVLDFYNSVFIVGFSLSNDYPVTDSSKYKSGVDAIITNLNEYGNSIIYSTYLNGHKDDYAYSIALDHNNIYAAGNTTSVDFPVTKGSYSSSYQAFQDNFVLKFCSGIGQIQSASSRFFSVKPCSTISIDTIYIKNTGRCNLLLLNSKISGIDSSYFSVVNPEIFPANVFSGDSIGIVIKYSTNDTKIKTVILTIENNSLDSLWQIYLIGNYKFIKYLVNSSDSDTIFIDLDTICLGTDKDTTITIFNKSSIGTTFKIENVDPGLQIIKKGKAETGKGDVPQTVKRKKNKKKKHE